MDHQKLEKAGHAAAAIGLCPGQLYRLAAAGRAPCYRAGRALRFDVAELRAWMRSQAQQDVGGQEALRRSVKNDGQST